VGEICLVGGGGIRVDSGSRSRTVLGRSVLESRTRMGRGKRCSGQSDGAGLECPGIVSRDEIGAEAMRPGWSGGWGRFGWSG
jgi:hypothetical protein